MKINTIITGFFLVSILMLGGCAQNQLAQITQSPSIYEDQKPKQELCKEIYGTPMSSSVICDNSGCYLTVSGDSRVTYEYYVDVGVVDSTSSGKLKAGEKVKLKEEQPPTTKIIRVLVSPYDEENHEYCAVTTDLTVERKDFIGLQDCTERDAEYTISKVPSTFNNNPATKLNICNKENQEISISFRLCTYSNCAPNRTQKQIISANSCELQGGYVIAPLAAVEVKEIIVSKIKVCVEENIENKPVCTETEQQCEEGGVE